MVPKVVPRATRIAAELVAAAGLRRMIQRSIAGSFARGDGCSYQEVASSRRSEMIARATRRAAAMSMKQEPAIRYQASAFMRDVVPARAKSTPPRAQMMVSRPAVPERGCACPFVPIVMLVSVTTRAVTNGSAARVGIPRSDRPATRTRCCRPASLRWRVGHHRCRRTGTRAGCRPAQ
jgi:hypothetical protein